MRSTLLLVLLGLHGTAGRAVGQGHGDAFRQAGGTPTPDGCEVCHQSHSSGGQFGLQVGNAADQAPLQAEMRGASTVSASCWRCHAIPQTRNRQPDMVEVAPFAPGKFLSPDFSDDHPIGRIDLYTSATQLGQMTDPRRMRLAIVGPVEDVPTIECTTCHDPHDPTAIVPEPDQQRVICGSCHDAGEYTVGDHGADACGDCHSLHSGTGMGLIGEQNGYSACRNCHATLSSVSEDAAQLSGSTGRRVSGRLDAFLGDAHSVVGTCQDCHQIHVPG